MGNFNKTTGDGFPPTIVIHRLKVYSFQETYGKDGREVWEERKQDIAFWAETAPQVQLRGRHREPLS